MEVEEYSKGERLLELDNGKLISWEEKWQVSSYVLGEKEAKYSMKERAGLVTK